MVFKPQRLVCMYQQSECRNKGKEIPEAWIHQHLELAKSGVSRTRNWKTVAKAFRRNRMGSEEYVFKKWATMSQSVEELRIIKAENFSLDLEAWMLLVALIGRSITDMGIRKTTQNWKMRRETFGRQNKFRKTLPQNRRNITKQCYLVW